MTDQLLALDFGINTDQHDQAIISIINHDHSAHSRSHLEIQLRSIRCCRVVLPLGEIVLFCSDFLMETVTFCQVHAVVCPLFLLEINSAQILDETFK